MIAGQGLHGGERSSLRVVREPGPVRLRLVGRSNTQATVLEARVDELILDGSARSTCVSTRDGRLRVGTVEHLFAALGALSIYDGVVIEIDGGTEIPLADGGARMFFDALEPPVPSANGKPRQRQLAIVRAGSIDVNGSRYDFAPPAQKDNVHVEVTVDFADARLATNASWDGDPADFRSRIAMARTFGFAHEVEHLMARGLANHVARESVVVITPDAILSAGEPFLPDEPARHKLLDLIGDLYAHGGPPLGSIHATRPGHAATHEAMKRALAEGLLKRASQEERDERYERVTGL